jgi:hypothetical protein
MIYNYHDLFEKIVHAGLADKVTGGEAHMHPRMNSKLQALGIHSYFEDPDRIVAGLSALLKDIREPIGPIVDSARRSEPSPRLREIAERIGAIARDLEAFQHYHGLGIAIHVNVNSSYVRLYRCTIVSSASEQIVDEFYTLENRC